MGDEQNITLRQGLENFYSQNNTYLSHHKEGISNEAKSFFEAHDIAHVLFDCDISLFGEGSVKIWTIFGTTLGFWKHVKAYKEANAYELSKNISFSEYGQNIFRLLFSIPKLIKRARNMNKLWPWFEFEAYLDTPITDIRKEFNIQELL